MSTEITKFVDLEHVSALEVYGEKGRIDAILSRIEEQARSLVPDMSTTKGRKEIASVAAKVARSKTLLDGMGKDLKAEWMEKCKVVDAERRTVRERLDALKEEVRSPLTEWEKREEERVRELQARLGELCAPDDEQVEIMDVGRVGAWLERLKAITVDSSWMEFQGRAQQAKDAAMYRTESILKAKVEAEEQAAEEERKRIEAEEKARKEREERIAKEAAEAAKRAAEEKAKAEANKLEALRKTAEAKAKAEREKEERQRQEEARKAKEAIEDGKRQKAAAEKRAKESEERRKREVAEAKEREKQEKIRRQEELRAAEARAKAEQERAIQAERERVERERREEQARQAKIAADVEHQKATHKAIIEAIVPEYCSDTKTAQCLIVAIRKGQVPHVKIEY